MLKSNKFLKKSNKTAALSALVLLFVSTAAISAGTNIAANKIYKEISVQSGYIQEYSSYISELDNQHVFGELTNEEYNQKLKEAPSLDEYVKTKASQYQSELEKYNNLMTASSLSLSIGGIGVLLGCAALTLASFYDKKAKDNNLIENQEKE